MRDLLYRLGLTLHMLLDAPGLFERLYRFDWYGGMLHEWVDGLSLVPGGMVAEIGCGPGLLVRSLAERGFQVTGIDRSAAMVRRARRNLAGFSTAHIEQGNPLDSPCEIGCFDAVLAASLLNVVPDPAAALHGMTRLLRPGGVLSVLVPLPDHVRAGALAEGWRLRGMSRAALRHWAILSRKIPQAQLLELFRLADLRQITTRYALGGTVALVTGHRP